ncbi:MAG: DMT family transporter [Chloroflexi bacterium CFX4]|nr:DMT family transporter [Chloroflexi bacterium CFX4]MDL1921907.1 DMT family transporter [Chloroflexi bacterium CFX3]
MINSAIQRRAALKINTAFAAMIISAALWGSGTVFSKYTLTYLPPLTLIALELVASCTMLWLLLLRKGKPSHLNRRTIQHAWAGILEPGLTYLFFTLGLTLTSASSATLIMATEPVIVIALAWWLLRERIAPRLWLLMLAVMFGTLLVTLDSSGEGAQSLLGDLFIVLGTISTALYTIFSRAGARQMPPLLLAVLQQTCGLLFVLLLLPLEWLSIGIPQLAALPLHVWLIVIFTGITQSALAFWLYLRALKVIPATQAALLLTLIPIFGVSSAAVLLNEQMTWLQVGGGALILVALLYVRAKGITHV